MTRAELKNIMRRYTILDCEVENAIEFVRDLLEAQAEELEKNEPYATRTINRLWDTSRDVGELLEYVETAMEE